MYVFVRHVPHEGMLKISAILSCWWPPSSWMPLFTERLNARSHTTKKLHIPQTIHYSKAVFFEARRRKRGSTIQSTTNGNFRCSYISLWFWWWQNALEFEGRGWRPMPSVVRSTSQKFLAYSGTPSSSYCSTLIYNYFMINLATFFWNQKTIR